MSQKKKAAKAKNNFGKYLSATPASGVSKGASTKDGSHIKKTEEEQANDKSTESSNSTGRDDSSNNALAKFNSDS